MPKRVVLTLDDGLMLWKARDAYRVQTFFLVLFYLPQFFLALMIIHHVHMGHWAAAWSMVTVIVGLHALRWGLCTGLPRLVRFVWSHGRAGIMTFVRRKGLKIGV